MYDYADFHGVYWLDAIAHEYLQKHDVKVQYQPFVYGADFLPLAANATQALPVTIDRDADFIWMQNTHSAFDAATGAAIVSPNVLVRHTATSSQRELENDNVHLMNLYGTGERPYFWIKPLIMAAKTSLRVTLQNLTATAMNVRLSFVGVKAFLSKAG